MKVSVADRGTDNHTALTHNSLMTDNLGRQSLHHLNGIGSHTISIMEILRHTEHENIVFCVAMPWSS